MIKQVVHKSRDSKPKPPSPQMDIEGDTLHIWVDLNTEGAQLSVSGKTLVLAQTPDRFFWFEHDGEEYYVVCTVGKSL